MEKEYEKSDFINLDETERKNALNTSAEKIVEKYNYSKILSEGEIKQKNIEINQALQEINRLGEERKELSALSKIQTKIISENNTEVVSKFTHVSEKVWEVVNTASGFIEIINKDGYIIEKSRIKSGTQMNLFQSSEKKAM